VRDDLAAIAEQWPATCRTAWPSFGVDDAEFVASLLARLPADVTADEAAGLHVEDLYLAFACAAGDAAALAAFDREFLGGIAGALRAAGLTADAIDEVKQELRHKLLVAQDGPPRIAEYSGRAELRLWLRTAAVRMSIDLRRRDRRNVPTDVEELDELPDLTDDPELLHLKARYRDELRAAVGEAMQQLEPRERLLLKYHYVDKLGIEKLGDVFGVHRATTARWLNAARDALALKTVRLLVARLGVVTAEVRSIARLVESQLDISVARLL
jgi:RNA polymerase sigma-70 factor, ECF subfamily